MTRERLAILLRHHEALDLSTGLMCQCGEARPKTVPNAHREHRLHVADVVLAAVGGAS